MKCIYGLIGKKLGHSASAQLFNEMARENGLEAEYKLYEIGEIGELRDLIKNTPTLKGLNVTIPYKEAVLPYISDISAEAKEIGAVNTLKIDRGNDLADGELYRLIGYNTDLYGFATDIKDFIAGALTESNNALVLGTGGGSKTVSYHLRRCGFNVIKVSRHGTKELHRVLNEYKREAEGNEIGVFPIVSYESLTAESLGRISLIINTTPVGMYPEEDAAPLLPYETLSEKHYCYDLIYNPQKTRFLEIAEKQGAHVRNGMGMLEKQAEKAWEIWGVKRQQ